MWPCRTGVLVDDEVAYFCAGVFPAERVYVYAVNASDGSVIWKNDTISDLGAGRNGFSPQGYLLASNTTLYVPSGRSLPAAFDRKNGRFLYQSSGSWRSYGLIGGTYALLVGEHILTGTEQVLAYDAKSGRAGFAWFPGRRLVVAGDTAYLLSDEGIRSLNMKSYPEISRKRHQLQNRRKALVRAKPKDLEEKLKALEEEEKSLAEALKSARPWECSLEDMHSLILAGNTLFAGGDGRVVAVDAATGENLWMAEVEGKANGLAASDGRLLVSTDTGAIYCFARGERPAGASAQRESREPYPDDKLSGLYESAAEAIVEQTGVTKGYCLVLGCGTGRLAAELAKRTDLMIYGIEPDAEKAQSARRALSAAGLYGSRVCVDQGSLSSLPYSDYFANLVVSEDALVSGRVRGSAGEVLRVLKPIGGTVCIGQPARARRAVKPISARAIQRWLSAGGMKGAEQTKGEGVWVKYVRGPLQGAGSWTHQYGNPGNTASSEDELVKCPLGVLWYGDPGPDKVVNRHLGAAAPLSINGRVFLQGRNLIMCFDAYNGLMYWEREIPGAYRVGMVRECSNLAANEDSLFVATGAKCLRLDAATGETVATYDLPPSDDGGKRNWAYVAVVGDLLYGSTSSKAQESDSVFAVDVKTGDLQWVHKGQRIRNNTIAIDGGRVFFADNSATKEQREEALKDKIEALKARKGIDDAAAEKELEKADVRIAVALDAKTGRVLWERPIDLTDCGGRVLSAIASQGVLLFCGAHANGHYWPQFLGGEYAARRATALSAQDGRLLWSKAIGYRIRPLVIGDTLYAEPWAFDLRTGKQKTRTHPITGLASRWEFERPGHHCGTISGCPNTLFFRSGSIGYYDLTGDYGTSHFSGQRPGCWINTIPANGLAVIPEASSGCVCLFAIQCTVVLEPRKTNKVWGIYDAPGPVMPVKHIGINLGAPGDRRDPHGILWLGFPRPSGRMRLVYNLAVNTVSGGGYFSRAPELADVQGTDAPWLFASGASGVTKCSIPLLTEADGPAIYTVRLGFSDPDNDKPGQRVFDIKLQGEVVERDFDIVRAAGGRDKAVVREFEGVEVHDALDIELVPKVEKPTLQQAPLLNTIEITRTRVLHVGLGAPSLLLSDLDADKTGQLKLANRTGRRFAGKLRLRAPEGFSAAVGQTEVELGPDATLTIPLTVRVTKPGKPGQYQIDVALVGEDGTVETMSRASIEYLGRRGRTTVQAVEDTYVSHGSPGTNYGHSASILVDGGNTTFGDEGHNIGYLKFKFDVPGKVVSATLRLRTTAQGHSQSGDSGRICLVDQPWEEYKVVYKDRPEPGKEVGKLGRVGHDVWVERRLDVDLTGKKELSLVLEPTSNDGATYYSVEGGHPPELVIEYAPEQ